MFWTIESILPKFDMNVVFNRKIIKGTFHSISEPRSVWKPETVGGKLSLLWSVQRRFCLVALATAILIELIVSTSTFRNDYYKSQSHWNLNNAIDRAYSSEGVRPFTTIIRPHKSMADFDYNKLAKDTPWNERYGSWKREKWNSSGSSFNSFDYGGYHHYGPTFELEGRSDENDPKGQCYLVFIVLLRSGIFIWK